MNSPKTIGGYFELEHKKGKEYHTNVICLNTGRNAFEYILRANKYKKVYLPFYTCDVMLEPVNILDLSYEFYNIDENLYPIFNFDKLHKNDVFIYTNYFGICSQQIKATVQKCQNIIIDNSQAFYSKPLPGVDTFYSPRKFFGIPDGAYLYTNKRYECQLELDISYGRCEHLLGRLDIGAEKFYNVFKNNDAILSNQPIKKMSILTKNILKSINYNSTARKRIENFNFLHNNLKVKNQLKIEILEDDVPMIYPYLIDDGDILKKKLIDNKIFIPTYWANVLSCVSSNKFEYYLSKNLIALPIDQRYSVKEMTLIAKMIANE